MNGIIFNIQRMSIHDGPGIRTTVFLKGCPMRCIWCSNPESQSIHPEVAFSKNRCIGCGYCGEVCPKQIVDKKAPFDILDRSACDMCMKCIDECCVNAKKLTGETYDTESLLHEIMKDKPFYDKSGGGVTFSGGEALMQADFLIEMLKLCKKNGIHTAIECCGYVNTDKLLEAAPYVDLVFYDLKHMDSAKHKELTHVPNELILKNLASLAAVHSNITVRTPVIPGLNADAENITATADYVAGLGIGSYELLPYHNLGEIKYDQIGQIYQIPEVKTPSPEAMDKLMEAAKKAVGNRNTQVIRQQSINE